MTNATFPDVSEEALAAALTLSLKKKERNDWGDRRGRSASQKGATRPQEASAEREQQQPPPQLACSTSQTAITAVKGVLYREVTAYSLSSI